MAQLGGQALQLATHNLLGDLTALGYIPAPAPGSLAAVNNLTPTRATVRAVVRRIIVASIKTKTRP
jgi:hypothetical protein